jgi:TRAP-type C4-dicarboxylate transport system substrate-binding protein/DNA-binding XRE family transcriptional regulator
MLVVALSDFGLGITQVEMNRVDKDGIGSRIREARKFLGLRQTDLSDSTGLPASHLSDIEREVLTPTIPTLRKIGEALNRPLEYFLHEYDDRPQSMGMVVHGTSIGGQAAARFAQLVEAKTGGEIRLRIYQHAALGTAREQLQGLAEGAIHLYIDEPLSFESYCDLCGPVFLPYFFCDRPHYHRFLRSDIFAGELCQKLLNRGIRLLNPASNWECGSFELLFSTMPIFTPADLAGRKIRSYASRAAVALRRALGAEPVVVEWEQIYEAFEQGLVDTVLVPAAYFDTLEIYRLASHATLLSYGYTLNLTVAASEREYRKLPPSVQQALLEAIEETGVYCTDLAGEQTVLDLENLSEQHGLPIIHPSQEAWREHFTAAVRQICDEGLLSRDMYERLQNL